MNKTSFLFLLFFLLLTACVEKKQIEQEIGKSSPNINKTKIDTSKKIISSKTEIKNESNEINQPIGFDFTKGLYLTAYTVASKKFHSVLDSAEAAGINTIIFDLKNMNGNIFFSMPQNDSLSRKKVEPIINISKTVKALHKRDMKAVARVVMFHDQIWANADSLIRPSLANKSAWVESKKRGPSWLDSSDKKVQKELLKIISKIATQGVDEIQLDYIRFPTQGKISKAIFDFQKEDIIKSKKDSTYIGREKEDIIVDFVKQAKLICEKQNVKLTADIFAIVAWQRASDMKSTGQNITRMTRYLDAIHPMIYSSHFNDDFGYRENVRNESYHIMYKATHLSQSHTEKKCKIIPYIQAFSWKVNYDYEYLISQIKAIEDTKADGYILWNSGSRYDKTLRWMKRYYQK